MCYVELAFHMDYVMLAKCILMSLFLFYILLSSGLKEVKLGADGVEIFYYLRPFAKKYSYRYEDVKKVYHECAASAGAFPLFVITTNRNHPFLFFRKKYLFFINKEEHQAKSIITNFKEKGVNIVLKGHSDTLKCLDTEEGPIEQSEAIYFATEAIMEQNKTAKWTVEKLIEKGLDERNANLVIDEIMPSDLREKERRKESNKNICIGLIVLVADSVLLFLSLKFRINSYVLLALLCIFGIRWVVKGVLIRYSKI